MLTGTHIVDYLAENFSMLYHTGVDIKEVLAGSLTQEKDYGLLMDKIVLQPKPLLVKSGHINLPVFYYDLLHPGGELSGLSLEEIAVNAFLLLSGWQEKIIEKRDQYGRFPFSESLQAKFHFQQIPIVNYLFEEICRRINLAGHPCKAKKFSAKGSNVIFSHDIDRLYSGWFEGTGNMIRKPALAIFRKWLEMSYSKYFRQQDDYQAGLCRLLDLLDKWDIQSIFFFLANQSRDDADYTLADSFISQINSRLIETNHLAGIHGGFDTYLAPELMKSQISYAEKSLGRKILHNRQHFLKFDVKQTPCYLLKAGIEFDFSLGFAESAGFRNSIATPFLIFDFDSRKASSLVEIPLFFMDGTYSHYQKVPRDKMQNPLEELARVTGGLNLNFSVLFHNTVFTGFKYSGFTELFEEMAGFCRKNEYSTDAHVVWPEI
jgi:hypothetical protein